MVSPASVQEQFVTSLTIPAQCPVGARIQSEPVTGVKCWHRNASMAGAMRAFLPDKSHKYVLIFFPFLIPCLSSFTMMIDEASYWTGQCDFICFSLFSSYFHICITTLVLSKSCLSVVCPWERLLNRNVLGRYSVSKILFPFFNIVFCYNLVCPLEW